MHAKMSNRKFGNTLVDYSSGRVQTLGVDRNLITTSETLNNVRDENAIQSKSLPSSHKKKKLTGRFNGSETYLHKDAVK
jgi:hypothetical protein